MIAWTQGALEIYFLCRVKFIARHLRRPKKVMPVGLSIFWCSRARVSICTWFPTIEQPCVIYRHGEKSVISLHCSAFESGGTLPEKNQFSSRRLHTYTLFLKERLTTCINELMLGVFFGGGYFVLFWVFLPDAWDTPEV